MKKLKNIIGLVLFYYFVISSVYATGSDAIRNKMIKNVSTNSTSSPSSGSGLKDLDGAFGFFKNTIFDLLAVIVVGVFLYMGIKLVVSRGNPEELKKVISQFIYVAVGIFVVSAAWAIVTLVSGLNF